jgi:hypothetical protein
VIDGIPPAVAGVYVMKHFVIDGGILFGSIFSDVADAVAL